MEKSSKRSTTCKGNPKETRRKYAETFAGIVVLTYLKDREVMYTQMSIDKFFGVSEFRSWTKWIFPLAVLLTSIAVPETFPILSNLSSHGSGMYTRVFFTSKISYEEKLNKH